MKRYENYKNHFILKLFVVCSSNGYEWTEHSSMPMGEKSKYKLSYSSQISIKRKKYFKNTSKDLKHYIIQDILVGLADWGAKWNFISLTHLNI